MDLRILKYLVSLAERGSFTAAAREHFVTQPAVSIQLRRLQAELGVRLYDIVGRKPRFTAAGERALEYARRMIDLEQQLRREMDDLAGLRRGGVSIGAIDAAGIYVLPPVFSAFRARYPGIDLRVEIASTLPLLEGLGAGKFDLVVGTMAGGDAGAAEAGAASGGGREKDGAADAGAEAAWAAATAAAAAAACEAVEVFRERLVPVAPLGHPLLAGRGVRALADYPFISFHRRSVTRRLIEETLRERGVELDITMEIDSQEAIRNLVASGLGLSILPRPTVREALERGVLAEARIAGLRIERRIGLMVPPGRYLPAPVRAFLAVMGEVLGMKPPRGVERDRPPRSRGNGGEAGPAGRNGRGGGAGPARSHGRRRGKAAPAPKKRKAAR